MRMFGSSRRNPNPSWPGVQTGVVLPPGSEQSLGQRQREAVANNNSPSMQRIERETLHERDGFEPIMNYMTESRQNLPYERGNQNRRCSNLTATEYLCNKTGSYAKVEFMFGENTHIEKTGMLESVGKDFIVLTEAGTGSQIVCSAKNIKFINIYNIK